MAYQRECVPAGQDIVLRAIFTDSCGEPVDPDADSLNIYIYSGSALADNSTQLSEDVDSYKSDPTTSGLFSEATEAIAGSSVTQVATGFYEYTYTVPSWSTSIDEDDIGGWNDIWTATTGGMPIIAQLSFTVVELGSVANQTVGNNTLIVVLLDADVADTDGNTLGEEIQLSFSTQYTPYYASPDLLRLECGGWIDGVPDETLSLFIHWSSIEVDQFVGNSSGSYANNLSLAKTKFVIYDAALRVLMLPADLGGKTKSLGDLLIKNNDNFQYIIDDLKANKAEWERVVNAGGAIVRGQGLAPTYAVKGKNDPERRRVGRLWKNPRDTTYDQPTVNKKSKEDGELRHKFHFEDLE